jgi:aspartyl protease family protein
MALPSDRRQALGMSAGGLALACDALSLGHVNDSKGVALAILGLPSSRAPAERPADMQIKAGAHGRFFASAEVNGRPTAVLVDLRASSVALAFDAARHAGVCVRDSDYIQRVSTANGLAGVAIQRNMPAVVTEPGSLATSLLGMSLLARLQRFGIRAGTLLLQE